ncbi:MAG: hypothetical protein ABL882_12315, partial [Sphingopyxis sp.]
MSGTTTGNRALMLEEPLIFEIGDANSTGVDFDTVSPLPFRGGGVQRHVTLNAGGVAPENSTLAERPHPNPSPEGEGLKSGPGPEGEGLK